MTEQTFGSQATENQNHQLIMDAFLNAFSDMEEMSDFVRSLGKFEDAKNRGLAYSEYGLPVFQSLGDNANQIIIDFLVNPKNHFIPFHEDERYFVVNEAAVILAANHIGLNPSQASADALMDRVKKMIIHWQKIEKGPNLDQDDQPNPRKFLEPQTDTCTELLIKHINFSGVEAFLYDLFAGRIHSDHDEKNWDKYKMVYILSLDSNSDEFDTAAPYFYRSNRFTFDYFNRVGRLFPRFINSDWLFDPETMKREETDLDKGFLSDYHAYSEQLLSDLIDELPGTEFPVERVIGYGPASGLKWLDKGLKVIEKHGLKPKDLKDSHQNFLGKVIIQLVGQDLLSHGETESDAIGVLKQFKPATLLSVLPYGAAMRELILKALGLEELIEVQQFLFNMAGGNPAENKKLEDIPNCPDPDCGVVDQAAILKVIKPVKQAALNKYLKALQSSSLNIKTCIMLVNAIRGFDQKKIEKLLIRHNPGAIKAYGLYPIENKTDLKNRYLKLKAMHKEAKKYGSTRRANTEAAVLAGLKNLARTAGFTDEIRMEWTLEADIAKSMIPFNAQQAIENWTIELVLEGILPKIQIRKDDKTLKSVPAKVKKSKTYKTMRDSQDNIRSQAGRFKNTLETIMCNGEKIKLSELKTLAKVPVINGMLRQLILKSRDRFGLFSGDAKCIIGFDNTDIPVSGDVEIAHVYHLFKADILHNWQQTIVRQRIIQPFKQAFRELYLTTPAELDAKDHSSRFDGHVVDSAKTARLLETRGWNQLSGDVVKVYKYFPGKNTTAEIGFPDAHTYLSGMPEITIGGVWFTDGNDKIPLNTIDPVLFSEVMRDVDLVVSVAQVTDNDGRWSSEVAKNRMQLIETLVSETGIEGVACEGNFAHIKGKLARYRIHLGSGIIHIEPGNYLCVVPENKSAAKDIYLPFSDKDDKMTEIISKIFLLVDDDLITDTEILKQINPKI